MLECDAAYVENGSSEDVGIAHMQKVCNDGLYKWNKSLLWEHDFFFLVLKMYYRIPKKNLDCLY